MIVVILDSVLLTKGETFSCIFLFLFSFFFFFFYFTLIVAKYLGYFFILYVINIILYFYVERYEYIIL